MSAAWKAKQADPSNPFDEYLEREWVESWLFYANSIRYAAAMSGPDYATFKYGWWELTKRIREMNEKKGKR
jgi:hydroxylamine dehydrogenase